MKVEHPTSEKYKNIGDREPFELVADPISRGSNDSIPS